jgi:hypothetical protein
MTYAPPVDLRSKIGLPEDLNDVASIVDDVYDALNELDGGTVTKTLRRTIWFPLIDDVVPPSGGYGALPQMPVELATGQVQKIVGVRGKVASGSVVISVKVGGATVSGLGSWTVDTTADAKAADTPLQLATGDYVEVTVDSGSARTLSLGVIVEDVL